MQTNYKTKDIKPEDGQQKQENLQEFHFPGSCKYVPLTITASSLEEARELWEKQRVEASQNN